MSKIMKHLKNVSRIYLTSATDTDILPDFLNLDDPIKLDFLGDNKKLKTRMRVRTVVSDGKDKLQSLGELLRDLTGEKRPERSIVFVNHRESAERVYEYLRKTGVDAALYHGALDQAKRETALALFNSGARPVLVATDLAARGLDIRDVKNIIHYHQPLSSEAYTHRNGRTARVDESGDVFILLGPDEELKEYVSPTGVYSVRKGVNADMRSNLEGIYINGGKREKLSRGDILGFLTKEAGIPGAEIGKIDIFDHYSLVAVSKDQVSVALNAFRSKKIKGEKRKASLLE